MHSFFFPRSSPTGRVEIQFREKMVGPPPVINCDLEMSNLRVPNVLQKTASKPATIQPTQKKIKNTAKLPQQKSAQSPLGVRLDVLRRERPQFPARGNSPPPRNWREAPTGNLAARWLLASPRPGGAPDLSAGVALLRVQSDAACLSLNPFGGLTCSETQEPRFFLHLGQRPGTADPSAGGSSPEADGHPGSTKPSSLGGGELMETKLYGSQHASAKAHICPPSHSLQRSK